MALLARNSQHVHTVTAKRLSVLQMAFFVKRKLYVHIFTCKGFSVTGRWRYQTEPTCTYFHH